MAAIAHTDFADDLTYLQFPYALVTDQDNLLKYYNEILFNNPETSKLIAEEAEQQGVKLYVLRSGCVCKSGQSNVAP